MNSFPPEFYVAQLSPAECAERLNDDNFNFFLNIIEDALQFSRGPRHPAGVFRTRLFGVARVQSPESISSEPEFADPEGYDRAFPGGANGLHHPSVAIPFCPR